MYFYLVRKIRGKDGGDALRSSAKAILDLAILAVTRTRERGGAGQAGNVRRMFTWLPPAETLPSGHVKRRRNKIVAERREGPLEKYPVMYNGTFNDACFYETPLITRDVERYRRISLFSYHQERNRNPF